MPEVAPHVISNGIMGKLYDVLTNGDDTVPNPPTISSAGARRAFPSILSDFQFLSQGFTGVVKKAAVDTMLAATSGTDPAAAGGAAAPGSTGSAQGVDPRTARDAARPPTRPSLCPGRAAGPDRRFVLHVAKINNDQFAKFSVMNDQGTLSEIYERTLKMSQVMEFELTDDEKKKIAHFQSLLTATTTKTDIITGDKVEVSGPSPLVQLYNDKMSAYLNAALEYNSHRIDALAGDDFKAVSYFAINANILRAKVRAAMDDWVSSGYKEDYEKIAAYIAQVEDRDLTLLKQSYRDDLEKARRPARPRAAISSTRPSPPPVLPPPPAGPASPSSQAIFRATQTPPSIPAAGRPRPRPATSASAPMAGPATANSPAPMTEPSTPTASRSASRSPRSPSSGPGSNPPICSAIPGASIPAIPKAVKNDLLSDGGSPPKGLMVAYPNTIVFIRNLNMQMAHSEGFQHFLDQHPSDAQGGGGKLLLRALLLRRQRQPLFQQRQHPAQLRLEIRRPGLDRAGHADRRLQMPRAGAEVFPTPRRI